MKEKKKERKSNNDLAMSRFLLSFFSIFINNNNKVFSIKNINLCHTSSIFPLLIMVAADANALICGSSIRNFCKHELD